MPASKKISKEAIIEAAVDVLRENGYASVNARSVAKKLGCSTQPIYLSFQNMEELKNALTERAIDLHTKHVRDSLQMHDDNESTYSHYSRYSSYGMGFIQFAAQEKQLFRWLYLDGRQLGPYQNDVLLPEIIEVMQEEFGYGEEIARKIHRDMAYYSYGMAILANTDHLNLTDQEVLEAFRREFSALTAYYGVPAKKPEVK